MAGALQVPPTRLQSHEPSLGRRPKRSLNPIIEEGSDDDGQGQNAAMNQQRRRDDAPHLKIETWLSPMSDHFLTPRAIHHLSAPEFPPSPSSISGDGSSPATTSTNIWNRGSMATENTEFEDLYDVSDEEDDDALSRQFQQTSQTTSRQPFRLAIPSNASNGWEEPWSAVDESKKTTSSVPITPAAQLHMSPAQMDFMGRQQALDVSTTSTPPSLDGSLSSEQLAAMSAPQTPVIGDDQDRAEENWAGVRLQPDALATLQALSSGGGDAQEHPSQMAGISMPGPQPTTEMRQQPLRVVTSLASQTTQGRVRAPSPVRRSLFELTALDIPSPAGFFSTLSPRTRSTWHPPTPSPADLPPPTSTTAEQFYRCPWNIPTLAPPVPKRPDAVESFYQIFKNSSDPIEHIVGVHDDGDDFADGMPTARPTIRRQDSNGSETDVKSPPSPEIDETLTEIVVDYDHDPDYLRKQQQQALSNLGRTELWLLAQRAYFKGVHGEDNSAILRTIEQTPDDEDEAEVLSHGGDTEVDQNPGVPKKVVRFSNVISTASEPRRLPPKLLRQESAYYRSFQDYIVRTQLKDVFVQQLSRYEALQAQRTALREAHRNQLLGKYQLSVVPQSAKKRLSANVARGDLVLVDDPEKLRKEKEFEALKQMTIPAWHVAALKFLNGGRLISAPVTKRLARLSHVAAPGKDGIARDRARILDLGGQSTGDWAWHCALQYPNAKVYTVTTKAIRQLSNSNIRGPPNHRQVAVRRLTKLPFPDDHFDLVSARELHSILKFAGEKGEDEWEGCLRECMRVLKPGGYLDFSIMDADMMNAGPLGLAKSVEFGFTLRTLGYDPSPSKRWLGRLSRAGFDNVRRAWVCLPVGARRKVNVPPTPPPKDDQVFFNDGKATLVGSSDNIANVCGIVGAWSWERWLLRCEMEKVAGEMRLADMVTAGVAVREAGRCLEGVHAALEEGRDCGSGFRMLRGYARKATVERHVIRIALGE